MNKLRFYRWGIDLAFVGKRKHTKTLFMNRTTITIWGWVQLGFIKRKGIIGLQLGFIDIFYFWRY